MKSQHAMTAARKRKIVSRNERGQLVVAMQPGNQFKNGLGGPAVEVACGLIGQQELRLRNECTGQSHTLLFAAGKFSCTVMSAKLKSYLTQPMNRVPLNGGPGLLPNQQRHGRVLQSSELGQQVMKLPHKPDFTIPEIRRGTIRERIQVQVGAVYVTERRPFKSPEDVK